MARIRRMTGRRKIEIKKIGHQSNLQVTFSKRHNGIFKKASELCILCAAEVAIIIFSPGNKVFSFGHPNISDLVNRLLDETPPQSSRAMQVSETQRNVNVRNLNAQLVELSEQQDIEHKRRVELNKLLKSSQEKFWWAVPIEEMGKPQLELLMSAMKDLERTLEDSAKQIQDSNQPQFISGNSSGPIALPPTPQLLIYPPGVPANGMFDGNMMLPPQASHGLSDAGRFSQRFY